jgi:hypothetical protein
MPGVADRRRVAGGAQHDVGAGATGAVLTTTLVHSMRLDGLTRGLVTLCIGGGQGIALYTANICMAGTDGVFNSMGEGMIVNFDGVPLASGNGAPDEIITAEVRPKLADEARRIWGVENNIYQFGHRGFVAVKGGAQDCPYTYMRDVAAGKYRLPWEDEVEVTDGSSCGFPIPNRAFQG